MDPLIAQLETDPQVTRLVVTESARGIGRPVHYRVPTANRDEALTADGLPAVGSVLPAPAAGLIALERRSAPHPKGSGFTLVTVTGVSPEIAVAFDPRIVEGPIESYAEVRSSSSTVQVRKAYNDLTQEVEPLAEGVTLGEETGQAELVAHAFLDGPTAVNAVAYFVNAIQNRTNSNQVTFPPLRYQGPDSRITADAEQLLARSIDVKALRAGLVEVVMTFGFAPSDSYIVTVSTFGDGSGGFAGVGDDKFYRPQGAPVGYNLSQFLPYNGGTGGGVGFGEVSP